jgi:hypothetical protein
MLSVKAVWVSVAYFVLPGCPDARSHVDILS